MQRVPPVDGEFDDRNIDRADQRENRRGRARRLARILDRPPQRDQGRDRSGTAPARRSGARPTPTRSPHIGLPHSEPVTRQMKVKAAPSGAAAFCAASASGMAPDQRAERRRAHHDIDQHGEPGGRHMQIHDADRLALLIVGRREKGEPEPHRQQDQGKRRQRRDQRGGKAKEVGGVGISQHGRGFRGCGGRWQLGGYTSAEDKMPGPKSWRSRGDRPGWRIADRLHRAGENEFTTAM